MTDNKQYPKLPNAFISSVTHPELILIATKPTLSIGPHLPEQ